MTGLTDEQVNERIAEGKVNADENPNTRTYKQIIRENTLTFFNFRRGKLSDHPCRKGQLCSPDHQ